MEPHLVEAPGIVATHTLADAEQWFLRIAVPDNRMVI
jgi:hypothetical protein